ncbi:hypothetical protein T459_20318 [Capsicum annuum]|uniref:Uncharacterized protein n=1 Tax=Capsicum annuum TaxID=4072 RepID=A0A2G2Z478_CAPAN|nr:hypothetical protein T459_20318 [Capsicum annuum]
MLCRIEGNSFEVVETEEQIELSFTRTWDPSLQDELSPLTIDKRFRYMAMADDRERLMPLPEDGVPLRGKELAYTEAVLLILQWDSGKLYVCVNLDAQRSRLLGVGLIVFQVQKIFQKPTNQVPSEVRLVVNDRYISKEYLSAKGAFVGITPPGDAGSFQRECKMMKAISQSKMFVLGTITSMHGYLASLEITNMASASDVDIGELVYEPLRSGPTLWEIEVVQDAHDIVAIWNNHVIEAMQFPPIESWGYLYPKTIAVCLEPCHVSRYPNSSYDSIDFSQSCDSGKPHDLSQLSDISNIPPVNGIQADVFSSHPLVINEDEYINENQPPREVKGKAKVSLEDLGEGQVNDFSTYHLQTFDSELVFDITDSDGDSFYDADENIK